MGQLLRCKSSKKVIKQNQTFSVNHPLLKVKDDDHIKNLLIPIKSTSPEELYQILNILYSDDGQTVWKVKHKKVGLLRAMIRKERKDEETERKIIKTMNISKSLDHPGILKVFEIYESTEYYNIISELTDGRSLLDELNDTGPFQEKVAANIIYQLLGIINYLHNTKEIIHCRINPNNISLNSLSDDNDYYDIKLMHFNDCISNSNGNKEREQFLNSIKNATNFDKCFFPPEINKSTNLRTNPNLISDKIDIWGIGLVAYFLFTGKIPNLNTFKENDLNIPIFERISPHGKKLIRLLLHQNPSKRISAKNAIKSKWFTFLETKKSISKIIKPQYKKIMNNIKKYRPTNKLFEISLAYLVHNIPDIEDVRNINKVYMNFNTNSDGKMTKEEIKEGFESLVVANKGINKKQFEKVINDFFTLIDNDGNGFIEYEEFARAGIDKKLFVEKEVLEFAFNFFDRNNSGKILAQNLNMILSTNEKEKEEEINVIRKDLNAIITNMKSTGDIMNDGTVYMDEISFELYEKMMLKFLI